jgi:hypothetical protein
VEVGTERLYPSKHWSRERTKEIIRHIDRMQHKEPVPPIGVGERENDLTNPAQAFKVIGMYAWPADFAKDCAVAMIQSSPDAAMGQSTATCSASYSISGSGVPMRDVVPREARSALHVPLRWRSSISASEGATSSAVTATSISRNANPFRMLRSAASKCLIPRSISQAGKRRCIESTECKVNGFSRERL